MFDNLSKSLTGFFGGLRGKRLTEKNIREGLATVRTALLEADVNVQVVRAFLARVTEKAIGETILKSLRPDEEIARIVYAELVELMGAESTDVPIAEVAPTVILMAGLQGSGKTTTCGKLARLLESQGRKPLLVAADVQRPAAVEQLRVVGGQLGIPVHAEDGSKDVVGICQRGIALARATERDLVILDTAGRLHVDEPLMAELKAVATATRPHQVYLVCDGLTGQDAVKSAARFNTDLAIDGVILTKMDGDSRGGAALSVRHVTGKPIKFIGTGEKLDRLEPFRPEGMASRIIGTGDLRSLVDRAAVAYDQEEAARLQKALLDDSFSLDHFRTALRQVKKMGSLKDLMKMIPGIGSQVDEADLDDAELDKVEAMINSMTPKERTYPNLINQSRRTRIAGGSGTQERDVNELLKQFKEMRKMLKSFSKIAGMIPGFGASPGLGGGGGMGGLDIGSLMGMGGPAGPRPGRKGSPGGRRR